MAAVCERSAQLISQVEERLLKRNQLVEQFFSREAFRLAEACRSMSERFLEGGRLLAFGRGPYATDAQHVSVEFVHPVIVGKRALPALDISMLFRPWLETILHPQDIVMGFGPPEGDDEIHSALKFAESRHALTFALPGAQGSYAVEAFTDDAFIHQEMIEVLYHTVWESVHVFLEHKELGHDVGAVSYTHLGLLQDNLPRKGDWVLIHVGFALSKISEEDAMDQMRILRVLGEAEAAMQEVEGYGLENAENAKTT